MSHEELKKKWAERLKEEGRTWKWLAEKIEISEQNFRNQLTYGIKNITRINKINDVLGLKLVVRKR